MMSLKKISGLPILFDEQKFDLVFEGDFPIIKKSERTLNELRPYLKNPDIKNGPDPVYYVWRHVNLASDDEKIKNHNLRYDLTLMAHGTIGNEFVKTAGHYHKPYPEVYEVLLGHAYFLAQSNSSVYLAKASQGEKFIIPPGFGHNTINDSGEPLLLANFVSEKAAYDYESYKNKRGAMYYLLDNNNRIDIVKNPNYQSAPEIKKISAKEYPEFGLLENKPLYSLVKNIDKLRFLNHPEEFAGEWRNW